MAGGEGGRDTAASYVGLIGLFNAVFAGFLWLVSRRGQRLPERVQVQDIVLLGVATHKLSRLLTKAEITAPLRAPFTEFEEKGGPAEVEERAEGQGLRRAVGKLLTCPYCIDTWLATAFHFALVLVPAPARLAGAILSSVALADFLHATYVAATERALKS